MTEQEKIINSMQGDIHQIKIKLDQLFTALVGSEVGKDGGLVGRISELEKDNEKLREKIETIEKTASKSDLYLKIIWGICGAIGTALGGFLINYITKK